MGFFGYAFVIWLALSADSTKAFSSPREMKRSHTLSMSTSSNRNIWDQSRHRDNNQILPPNWKFSGFSRRVNGKVVTTINDLTTGSGTSLQSSTDGAIMPDGGTSPCVIKVVGVGGGGSNAVDRMLDTGIEAIDFWSVNTDAQALGRSKAKGAKVLNLGAGATRGLGAGGVPDVGRLAAEESRKEIEQIVMGADLCFITAGMGGGTGSGAAPVVAEIAKASDCLTVAIVTKPFMFEGTRRMKQARAAIKRLRENVDTVIVISNDRLLDIIPEDTPIEQAFAVADDILRQGVVGISDIIVKPGLVNVDFADVRSVMSNAGTALMGIGMADGKAAAIEAATAAISSPLIETSIKNAQAVVINVVGGDALALNQVYEASKMIQESVDENANVIFGAQADPSFGDTVSITVLAAGFSLDDNYDDVDTATEAPPPPPHRSPRKKPLNDVVRNRDFQQSAVSSDNRRSSQDTYVSSPSKRTRVTSQEEQPSRKNPSSADSSNEDLPDFLKGLKKQR